MRRPGIAIVAHTDAGGSGVVARDLAGLLAARGRPVTLLTPGPRSRTLAGGVEHVHVQAPGYNGLIAPESGVAMASAIIGAVERGATIVHTHYALPWLASAALARAATRIPFRLVCTLHGTDVVGIGVDPAYRPTLDGLLARADAVVAPSRALRSAALEAFASLTDVRVVSNFVDASLYAPLERAEREARRARLLAEHGAAPAGPDSFWVAHVSTFRSVKRTDTLAPIVAALGSGSDVRLVLVGDGPQHASTVNEARAALGAENVVATGSVESPARMLPLADALLLPSAYESFGLVALEALACGVPVVASDVGGLAEVVGPDAGILCAADDIAAFSRALERLASEPALRCEMGGAGRARAVERFSPAEAARAHDDLYEALAPVPA